MIEYMKMDIDMDRIEHNGQDWQNEYKCIERIENGRIVQNCIT
jgi:hypothetical protein